MHSTSTRDAVVKSSFDSYSNYYTKNLSNPDQQIINELRSLNPSRISESLAKFEANNNRKETKSYLNSLKLDESYVCTENHPYKNIKVKRHDEMICSCDESTKCLFCHQGNPKKCVDHEKTISKQI